MQLSATTAAPAALSTPAAAPGLPANAPAPQRTPIARARITPPGFEGKVFDVVAGATWTSGHASVDDAIRAVWQQGNPYRMVGVVERDSKFAVVDLLTVDDAGTVLTGLPTIHDGTDWIAAIPDTPLRAVHLLGDFGGPVDLLPTAPASAGR